MESLLKEFNLTEEQEAAVDIKRNIALSAGAGSGKTRVLTARFLYLLASGVDIDSIVALTFTEKAALEMKERVMEAIFHRIKKDRENRTLWQTSLDKLSGANISTIHSFCASILRENATYVGIDYNFGIVDELEGRVAIDDIWQNMMHRYSEEDRHMEFMGYMSDSMGKEYSEEMLQRDILGTRVSILESGWTLDEFGQISHGNKMAAYVIDLMLELDRRYAKYKLDRDILDYNDLQTLCFKVLSDRDINDRYNKRYRYFMVDEFQDTNEIQKNIIYALVKDGDTIPSGSLFVVGDFKQSIYGFRGTDYRIFGQVQSELGDDNNKSLKTCFRSEGDLVHGINSIFTTLIDPYEPMVPFKEEESKAEKERRIKLLKYSPQKATSGAKASMDELKRYVKSKDQGEIEDFYDILSKLKGNISMVQPMEDQYMGEAVVRSIDILLSLGLEYGDICILVRSRSLNHEIEEKLLQYNIPYSIVGGSSLYETREIRNIMTVYDLVIDRSYELDHNYLKLLEVLKSDLFNLPDDLLLFVRKNQVENELPSYWAAIEYSLGVVESNYDIDKLYYAYSVLENLWKASSRLNSVQLLEHIVDECNIIDKVIWQENGLQKVRNIEKLLDIADELDREKLLSRRGLIEHLYILSEQFNEEQGALEALDGQAIKIMTIHQSKGLEFKGVIIPGMEKDLLYMSNRENSNKGIIQADARLLLRGFGDEEDEFTKHMKSLLAEETDENIRLLYVAMTRAKKYVMLVGREDNRKGDKLNSFLKMIEYAMKENKEVQEWVEIIS